MKEHLILPMLSTQYEICISYKKSKDAFEEFDKQLQRFPEFYNDDKLLLRKVKFYRAVGGRMMWLYNVLTKVNRLFKRK